MELQQHQVETLSLVRYQLETARGQSTQPSPLNVLALSTVHDALEAALGLCVEVYNVDVASKATFLDVFNAVNKRLPGENPLGGYRAQLIPLNQDRVNFKHHGSRPAATTIQRHLNSAADLLAELSRVAFGVELSQVSLVGLVANESVRTTLQSAQAQWLTGEHREAFCSLWIAFDDLIDDYQSSKSWHPGRPLFTTQPSFMPAAREIAAQGKVVEQAFEWMENLDQWVTISAIGIDSRAYAYFRAHTPVGRKAITGTVHFQVLPHHRFTEEVFERCFKFVVESALVLARDDFTFDAWAARQEATSGS